MAATAMTEKEIRKVVGRAMRKGLLASVLMIIFMLELEAYYDTELPKALVLSITMLFPFVFAVRLFQDVLVELFADKDEQKENKTKRS
jgi:hypothetical protein